MCQLHMYIYMRIVSLSVCLPVCVYNTYVECFVDDVWGCLENIIPAAPQNVVLDDNKNMFSSNKRLEHPRISPRAKREIKLSLNEDA